MRILTVTNTRYWQLINSHENHDHLFIYPRGPFFGHGSHVSSWGLTLVEPYCIRGASDISRSSNWESLLNGTLLWSESQMLITNTYVRFVPAQIFYEYLEPSQDLHIHVVSIYYSDVLPTRHSYVPCTEAHVPRASWIWLNGSNRHTRVYVQSLHTPVRRRFQVLMNGIRMDALNMHRLAEIILSFKFSFNLS